LQGKQLTPQEIERERMRQRMLNKGKGGASKAPKVDLDNLFGSGGATALKVSSAPAIAPHAGGFGGFNGAPQPQPGQGGGYGEFGGSAHPPAAPSRQDDGFGDFAAAPQGTAGPPANGGSFGNFAAAPTVAVSDDFGDFSGGGSGAGGGSMSSFNGSVSSFGSGGGGGGGSEGGGGGGSDHLGVGGGQESHGRGLSPAVSMDALVASSTDIGSPSTARKFEKKKKTLADAKRVERKVGVHRAATSTPPRLSALACV
jgi:hypothetical protein